MIDLESKFEVLEAEVKEINANKETLKRNLLDLIELQHILQKTQTFFMEVCDLVREGGREREISPLMLCIMHFCGDYNGNNGGTVYTLYMCVYVYVQHM